MSEYIFYYITLGIILFVPGLIFRIILLFEEKDNNQKK